MAAYAAEGQNTNLRGAVSLGINGVRLLHSIDGHTCKKEVYPTRKARGAAVWRPVVKWFTEKNTVT